MIVPNTAESATQAGLSEHQRKTALLDNRTNLAEASAKGQQANRDAANAYAANILPVVREIQAAGATTLRAIAAEGMKLSHVAVGNALKAAPEIA